MIKQSSFSQEWINTVSEKYQYHDRNLIEKVIRAYSLLEMLVKKRLSGNLERRFFTDAHPGRFCLQALR